MAHYALLDENNIVVQVITGKNENELDNFGNVVNWEQSYSEVTGYVCKRTSYNHNIRKQYAGIGFIYDPEADVFIAPQPYPSWLLDENYDWQPPVPKPNEGFWYWNENTISWINE